MIILHFFVSKDWRLDALLTFQKIIIHLAILSGQINDNFVKKK